MFLTILKLNVLTFLSSTFWKINLVKSLTFEKKKRKAIRDIFYYSSVSSQFYFTFSKSIPHAELSTNNKRLVHYINQHIPQANGFIIICSTCVYIYLKLLKKVTIEL